MIDGSEAGSNYRPVWTAAATATVLVGIVVLWGARTHYETLVLKMQLLLDMAKEKLQVVCSTLLGPALLSLARWGLLLLKCLTCYVVLVSLSLIGRPLLSAVHP